MQKLSFDPEVSSKWEDIAIALQLGDEDDGAYLEELAGKHQPDGRSLMDVFKRWLRSPHIKATRRRLIEALKTLDIPNAVSTMQSSLGNSYLEKSRYIDGIAFLCIVSTTPDLQACPQENFPSGIHPPLAVMPPTVIPSLNPPPEEAVTLPPGNVPAGLLPQCDLPMPLPIVKDYSLKMEAGQTIRKYQKELAQPGIDGKNYIIVAPTGSGKTVVAGQVISNHLTKNHDGSCCHVVFIVPTRQLASQQKQKLGELIPAAKVGLHTGDTPDMVADSIRQKNDITVCTAGKLVEEICSDKVRFDQLSLLVFDECHHVRKRHPYALLMEFYLEYRDDIDRQTSLPQIIGMTASPGAGDNPELDKQKTINHLLNLAARLDATGGFCCVTTNVEELYKCTKTSSISLTIIKPRDAINDYFISYITEEMTNLEQFVPAVKNHFEKWSQQYETSVQHVKRSLELCEGDTRDKISTLEVLRCYSNALSVYMDLRQNDAIKVLEGFTGLPRDDASATPCEMYIKHGMNALICKLKSLLIKPNPLLEVMKGKLLEIVQEKQIFRAIVFVRTKNHAYAMKEWILEDISHNNAIIPGVITGQTRESGAWMTQLQQEEVLSSFRQGKINLLIATSVAEEGLDVPECNLMIRYQHVSDEIAKVQTEGRARAEDSQGITIISSNSSKKLQELKNKELNNLVDDILQKKQFPSERFLTMQLKKIQQDLMNAKKLKAALKGSHKQNHTSNEVELYCKKCNTFVCAGCDLYKISANSPGSLTAADIIPFHCVVPDPEFKRKIICKPHHKPADLIRDQVKKTHKVYCRFCEADWGVLCVWPTDGHEFPVIKAVNFIFRIRDNRQLIKKWSAVPFEIEHLSSWLDAS